MRICFAFLITEKLNNEEVVNQMTTFVDWTRPTNGGNSPHMFGDSEKDIAMIKDLKNQELVFFIRKVPNLSPENILIKTISEHLQGRQ
jgi:hypothetical protein